MEVELLVRTWCGACGSQREGVMRAMDLGDKWRVIDPALVVWHRSHHLPGAEIVCEVIR